MVLARLPMLLARRALLVFNENKLVCITLDLKEKIPAAAIQNNYGVEFEPKMRKSPRSGRQHKAWGGAQRNPRIVRRNKKSPRSGAAAVRLNQTRSAVLPRAPRAQLVLLPIPWGSLRITPGFMLSPASRVRIKPSTKQHEITLICSCYFVSFRGSVFYPYRIVFSGPAGFAGSFTGVFRFAITSAMPRSTCGSRPSISDFGSFFTSMSGSTP